VDHFKASYVGTKNDPDHMKLRPATRISYNALLDRVILPALGRMGVKDVTPDDIRRMHDATVRSQPKRRLRGDDTSRGRAVTANRAFAVASCMFQWTTEQKDAEGRLVWRADNPCRGIKKLRAHEEPKTDY